MGYQIFVLAVNRVEKVTVFGLKWGQAFGKWSAYLHPSLSGNARGNLNDVRENQSLRCDSLIMQPKRDHNLKKEWKTLTSREHGVLSPLSVISLIQYLDFWCICVLLTKREGRSGRISTRGLDNTDRAQRDTNNKGPRANILPVRSQSSVVNKSFNYTIDWEKHHKHTILIEPPE